MNLKKKKTFLNAFGWKETTQFEFMPIQTNKKTWPWKYLHASSHCLIWLERHFASKITYSINLAIKKPCPSNLKPAISSIITDKVLSQWHDVVWTIKITLILSILHMTQAWHDLCKLRYKCTSVYWVPVTKKPHPQILYWYPQSRTGSEERQNKKEVEKQGESWSFYIYHGQEVYLGAMRSVLSSTLT